MEVIFLKWEHPCRSVEVRTRYCRIQECPKVVNFNFNVFVTVFGFPGCLVGLNGFPHLVGWFSTPGWQSSRVRRSLKKQSSVTTSNVCFWWFCIFHQLRLSWELHCTNDNCTNTVPHLTPHHTALYHTAMLCATLHSAKFTQHHTAMLCTTLHTLHSAHCPVPHSTPHSTAHYTQHHTAHYILCTTLRTTLQTTSHHTNLHF